MKKEKQLMINWLCETARKNALDELEHEGSTINGVECRRLRSCSARVYVTTNYYILQSYNTIIAVIDKNNNTLYDFLRVVYGYTATSAQHIAKFNNDYCNIKCNIRYTAR